MLAFGRSESDKSADVLNAAKRLAERLDITNVKYAWLRSRLKEPQHELEAGTLTIRLWEVNQTSQWGATPKLGDNLGGTFLLSVVPGEESAYVGTAFVTKPTGDAHAAQVMKSVQTFRIEGPATKQAPAPLETQESPAPEGDPKK
jgi:hypothetical protein